jgi:hypothetical protein
MLPLPHPMNGYFTLLLRQYELDNNQILFRRKIIDQVYLGATCQAIIQINGLLLIFLPQHACLK